MWSIYNFYKTTSKVPQPFSLYMPGCDGQNYIRSVYRHFSLGHTKVAILPNWQALD